MGKSFQPLKKEMTIEESDRLINLAVENVDFEGQTLKPRINWENISNTHLREGD